LSGLLILGPTIEPTAKIRNPEIRIAKNNLSGGAPEFKKVEEIQ
jgi:hypothetical protein